MCLEAQQTRGHGKRQAHETRPGSKVVSSPQAPTSRDLSYPHLPTRKRREHSPDPHPPFCHLFRVLVAEDLGVVAVQLQDDPVHLLLTQAPAAHQERRVLDQAVTVGLLWNGIGSETVQPAEGWRDPWCHRVWTETHARRPLGGAQLVVSQHVPVSC